MLRGAKESFTRKLVDYVFILQHTATFCIIDALTL